MENRHLTEEIDFLKYWSIVKRHWLPATAVAMLPLMALLYLAFSSEKQYEASGKLKFKRENVTSALVTEAGEKIGKLDSLKVQDTPLDTEAEILQSAPIVTEVIKNLNLKDKKGELLIYEDFLKNLKVTNIPGTDILMVSYRSPSGDQSAKVVNEVMKNYLKNNITLNRAEVEAAKQFVSQQLPKAEKALREAESNLQSFKTKNQIVDLRGEASLLVQQIGQIDQQISQLQGEKAKVAAKSQELRQNIGTNPQKAIAQSKVNNSIAVQNARLKLQEVERQLAVERTRYTEANPVVITLRDEQAVLKNLLNQAVREAIIQPGSNSRVSQSKDLQDSLTEYLVSNEAENKGLIKQLTSLQETKAAYAQRAKQIPQLEQSQKVLERQVEIAQTSYQALRKNLQELEITEKQQVGNAQIVSDAVLSKYPKSSQKQLETIGIVVGGITYLLTTFLLELVSPSLKSIKEIKKIFPYTFLGSLPRPNKKMTNIILQEQPNSLFSQAYRRVLSQITIANPDKNPITVIVTSSIFGEGKSEVAANLALAKAELGSQVLIIDADLPNPQQQRIWSLDNDQGLSDILARKTQLSLAIKNISKNLDLILAGHQVINPLALFNSDKMESLLYESLETYDFIIIDAPPLLLNDITLQISPKTDGIIFVVNPEKLETTTAIQVQEILKKYQYNLLGLVVNGVRINRESEPYFRYAKSYFNS